MSAKWERKEEGEVFFLIEHQHDSLDIFWGLICELHLLWGLLFMKSIGFEPQTACTLASHYDNPLGRAQSPGFSTSSTSASAVTCR